uniref:60S ribosomal export protein NMD3 n=1 Tax=Cannabis sativa TaxID=3483 RepID=A0A803Q3I8_CANSA
MILKHGAAVAAIKIKQVDKGIDFFFSNRSQGVKFVEFIAKVAPVIRSRHDKQLISHDTKSNNYNYKYTFSVEISPICREDLICLPSKVSLSLGNLGPLVICTKPGDKALGYDLYGANCNDIELDNYKNIVIPDVILVKKSYEEKGLRKRGKARLWKLKALNMEIENDKRGEEEKMKSEYEQFLDDLEENPDMRFNVSLYHNVKQQRLVMD